jgi:hypothetical protein
MELPSQLQMSVLSYQHQDRNRHVYLYMPCALWAVDSQSLQLALDKTVGFITRIFSRHYTSI